MKLGSSNGRFSIPVAIVTLNCINEFAMQAQIIFIYLKEKGLFAVSGCPALLHKNRIDTPLRINKSVISMANLRQIYKALNKQNQNWGANLPFGARICNALLEAKITPVGKIYLNRKIGALILHQTNAKIGA